MVATIALLKIDIWALLVRVYNGGPLLAESETKILEKKVDREVNGLKEALREEREERVAERVELERVREITEWERKWERREWEVKWEKREWEVRWEVKWEKREEEWKREWEKREEEWEREKRDLTEQLKAAVSK